MNQHIAVITGGTRGLGLGMAKSLIRRGASVAITYRSDEAAAYEALHQLESFKGEDQKTMLLKGDAGDPAESGSGFVGFDPATPA